MRSLLGTVQQLVKEGDGNKALAVLLHAVRLSHPDGEEGIFSFLDMAKELIATQRERDSDDDCRDALRVIEGLIQRESLLGEQGGGHILRDAFVDGSSIVCKRCDSLVKRERWDAHATKWCPALPPSHDDDDGDGDDC